MSPESIHSLKISEEEKKVLLDNLPKTLSEMNVNIDFSDLPDTLQDIVKSFGIVMGRITDNDYLINMLTVKSVDKDGKEVSTFYEKEKDALSRYAAHYMTETMKNSWIKLSNSQVEDVKKSFTRK